MESILLTYSKKKKVHPVFIFSLSHENHILKFDRANMGCQRKNKKYCQEFMVLIETRRNTGTVFRQRTLCKTKKKLIEFLKRRIRHMFGCSETPFSVE